MARPRLNAICSLLAGALLCAVGLASPAVVSADLPQHLRGRRVVGVDIAGETAGVTRAREIGIPIGATVTRQMLRQTIQRLLASERWSDVQLDLVEVPGGVRIVAHLDPRIVLTRIDVQNNDVLEDDEVLRTIDLSQGDVFERARMDTVARVLVGEYALRGYEQATVEVLLRDTDDPSRKVLVLRLDEGRPTRIREVNFDGDTPPRGSQGRRALELGRGDVLDRRDIDEAVRRSETRLRERGWLEARVGPATVTTEGTDAVISIRSTVGPHYTVRVVGHEPMERDDVVEALQLGDERLRGGGVLEGMRTRVVQLFQRRGFDAAEASVRRFVEDGEATLFVEVSPGTQLRVLAMSFPGARHFGSAFLKEQIESYLQEQLATEALFDPVDGETARLLLESTTPRAREIRAPLTFDPRRVWYEPTYATAAEHLQELYRSEGYLSAVVGPVHMERLSSGRGVVSVPVTEGPRSMLHGIELRGNEAFTAREILEVAELTRGMPFSHLALQHAIDRVVAIYREDAYLFAELESEIRFSGDRTRVEVILHVRERFQVHVGEIIIEGAEHTSERLVRDVMPLRPGDLYRPSLARQTEVTLAALGVFSGVTVAPQDPDLPARVKPVVIRINERKTQYLDFRFGVSTGDGIRTGLEYGYRNLFGYAISLTLRAAFSYQVLVIQDDDLESTLRGLPLNDQLERQVSASLVFPYIGVDDVRLSLTASHQRENERDFGFDKNGIDLSFGWRPTRQFSTSVTVGIENSDVGLFTDEGSLEELLRMTDDPRLRELLLVPQGESTLVPVGFVATYDRRDNAFVPTRGFSITTSAEWGRTLEETSVDIGGAEQTFFSNHVRTNITGSGYVPITDTVVFAAQTRWGRIFHLADESQTYPNRQFFMGGVDTLRGYLQDAMVPQDIADEIRENDMLSVNDVLRGADSIFLLRGELRFPIFGQLRAGVFADFGNLWAQAENFNPIELRPTAGFGIRLATPVGPLAFDYGFNLAPRTELEEKIGAFHFSIGLF